MSTTGLLGMIFGLLLVMYMSLLFVLGKIHRELEKAREDRQRFPKES